MDEAKKKKLEAEGWKVGSAEDFLGLTPEEAAYVELKLALASYLKKVREEKELTQVAVAEKAGSSQSRVAKMEKGDPSVSLDLLVRTLLELGATREEIGRVVSEHGTEMAPA